jgi:serine/threonine protein kinase
VINFAPVVELSQELIRQIKANNCIVFVGPDVSLPDTNQLGPPSPTLLALELALQLGGQFEDYSLPWIAQYYVDRYDASTLHKFVVDRLDNMQYAPTQIHFMLAQLPFSHIVYTAQDTLLREAFRRCNVPVNHVVDSDEGLSQVAERLLIQPYGSVSRPESLKLTEDERRAVFENRPNLAQILRAQTLTKISLFLGYAQGDPDFREFFHSMRPQTNAFLPRAHFVQAEITKDDLKYWSERNAAVMQIDTPSFLQALATTLGTSIIVKSSDTPPFIKDNELSRREKVILDFSQQLGLGGPVESGAQLQPIANALATLRQALHDYRKTGTAMLDEIPSNQSVDARLILQEGNIKWADGNLARAQEAFEEAIHRDPGLIDAYLSLHHLLIEIGKLDEAAEIYRQVISRDPTRAFIPPQYQLLRILGEIDVGVSYLCMDDIRKTEVVVTILRRALSHQTEDLKRFEEEVKTLNSVRISRLLEVNSYHARSYVVMQYIKGISLRRELTLLAGKEMQLSRIFEITNQIAEALQDGAQQGIPNLDLRPRNVLLTENGVVLTNYGFARLGRALRRSGKGLKRTRSEYEAPERRADEIGDQRSDVYALGTILYEMLTGRTPGVGEFRTASEAHSQAGEAVDVLIDHARAYEPAKRFQSITDMKLEAHRISLATDYHRFSQYTRIVLAKISGLYVFFFSRGKSFFTLGVVLALLLLGSGTGFPGWLNFGTRVLSLFAITSLVMSALGYYVVRDLARVRGLGSLINSGRGIGASLGLLFTAYLIRTTDWIDSGGLPGMVGSDFVGYVLVCLALILLLVSCALIVIHLAGAIFEKKWKHYTLGFYAGYLGLCVLFSWLLFIGPPPYMIQH